MPSHLSSGLREYSRRELRYVNEDNEVVEGDDIRDATGKIKGGLRYVRVWNEVDLANPEVLQQLDTFLRHELFAKVPVIVHAFNEERIENEAVQEWLATWKAEPSYTFRPQNA